MIYHSNKKHYPVTKDSCFKDWSRLMELPVICKLNLPYNLERNQ